MANIESRRVFLGRLALGGIGVGLVAFGGIQLYEAFNPTENKEQTPTEKCFLALENKLITDKNTKVLEHPEKAGARLLLLGLHNEKTGKKIMVSAYLDPKSGIMATVMGKYWYATPGGKEGKIEDGFIRYSKNPANSHIVTVLTAKETHNFSVIHAFDASGGMEVVIPPSNNLSPQEV